MPSWHAYDADWREELHRVPCWQFPAGTAGLATSVAAASVAAASIGTTTPESSTLTAPPFVTSL